MIQPIVPKRNLLRADLARGLSAAVLVVACSSGSSSGTSGKCEAISQEIHDAAVKRGYDGNHDGVPDSIGVCEDTNATIASDFGAACAKLRDCNAGH